MNPLETKGARRRWLGLAFFAMLPLCAGAQGTIVHRQLSTPNPDPNFPWDAQGLRLWTLESSYFYLDLDRNGVTDFTFHSGQFSTRGFSMFGSSQNAVFSLPSLDSHFVVPLASGSVIGPDSSPYEWYLTQQTPFGPLGAGLTACVDIGCIGLFTGVESAYAGLQFQIDGQTHYGWVRVGAPLVGANGGWIYEYAYDTRPDAPILAGAVPEPSTWALLGTGGLLFWWYGRRK